MDYPWKSKNNCKSTEYVHQQLEKRVQKDAHHFTKEIDILNTRICLKDTIIEAEEDTIDTILKLNAQRFQEKYKNHQK